MSDTNDGVGTTAAGEQGEPNQVATDAEAEIRDIALRIARGEDVVGRIITMRYFTYEIDGEDVIFLEDMRAHAERLAGARLVETTPAKYAGMRVLRFEEKDRQMVIERLGG